MGNWSELDYDLLGEIVLKLDAIEEFVYFSIVCRSWNRAFSLVKCNWNPSMPCLLLAENHTDNPDFLRKILSLENDRCYQLSLPQTFGARCWGSTCGWVVTIDLSRQIYMYNPFTKARLRLPPQHTLPNQELPLDNEEEDAILKRLVSITKAIVVKDVERGNNGNDWIVLAIHTNWKRFLSFARPGDLTWTSIVPPWAVEGTPDILPFSHRAAEVVCTDRSILILYEDASIGCLDLSDLSKSTKLEQSVKAKQFLPSSEVFKNRLNKHLQEMYFVKSLGNLLVVLRHKSNVWDRDSQVTEDEIYKTDRFEVFAFDPEAKKWEQVTELGDVALFVGDNQSISVRASDCRNCKSNCIYFTDDCVEFWDMPPKSGGHDMGFFDLADGKIHQFYSGDDTTEGGVEIGRHQNYSTLQMGNWSELDCDVLGEIALKLDVIEEFVYFSIVCRSWNRASSLVKFKWKPSMPCLMLAGNHTDNPNCLRKILSRLDNDRCYQLSFPHTFGARCWGSTCGWVVTLDRRQLYMYNPFTKARLRLPPQPTFPNQEPPLGTKKRGALFKRPGFITKAIVVKDVESGDDNNGNDLIVLAIHTSWYRVLLLSFARPDDIKWTSIVPPWLLEGTPDILPVRHDAVDVVCRDRLILILYDNASIGCLDLSELSKSTKLQQSVKAKQFLPSSEVVMHRLYQPLQEVYFVESLGNLLIVLRFRRILKHRENPVTLEEIYKTDRFEVFAFDSEAKKWEQVTELGDVALFIGDNQSISVRASDCRNCKSNCIYFTDDCDSFQSVTQEYGGHDMGFFDLADGQIHQFYTGDDVHSDFLCAPFWFMPQF